MRVQGIFSQRSRVLQRLGWAVCALVAIAGWCPEAIGADPAKEQNRIVAISVDQAGEQPIVKIQTQEPVGYRYTVYDSFDPIRVVVDFPGMDITGVTSPIAVNAKGLQEVRVSAFDLTSGKLARVELLLTEASGYNVLPAGNELKLVFDGSAPKSATASAAPKMPITKPVAPAVAAVAESKPLAAKAAEPARPTKTSATSEGIIESLNFQPGKAVFQLDAPLDKILSFELTAPPRLVVDFYGAKPRFKEQSFNVADGFHQVRVGTYEGKTRFVFDAAGASLPEHRVDRQGAQVVVGWSAATAAAAAAPAPVRAAAVAPGSAATVVQSVDFALEGNTSVLTVGVQGSPRVIEPSVKNGAVQFGVENALIGKELRRAIDTSAFASAVKMVTPFTEGSGREQDVLFAVELRGAAPYRLEQTPGSLRLIVENGEFAYAQPAPATVKPAGGGMAEANPVVAAPVVVPAPVAKPKYVAETSASAGYHGEKISLVFDDADTRKILQLIGEVSNLNIIAGDDIQGTVTLRLVDVPWDQALDLIMEIKGLGMIREGNVARIMPKEKLRAMDEAKMTAARARDKLETLDTEVITISYADLSNVAAPAKKMLTERGKITEDKRNKQLIVTDIPNSIAEIRKLVVLLDTPEKQVLIEARIVEATTTFSRDLGVKWGVSHQSDTGGNGSLNTANLGLGGSFLLSPNAVTGLTGTAGLGSALTFGRLGVDSTILDLRISALEKSGHGKVISTPRVTTMNGSKAVISQGTEIPYQSTDENGKTETEFKKAELSLTVTPEINPDGSIFLQILAKNDSRGADVPTGLGSAPAIDTKTADTKVLVRDGETTVIGGIFVEEKRSQEDGVPYLMKIPILGHLFKSSNRVEERRELLVFITPRILTK